MLDCGSAVPWREVTAGLVGWMYGLTLFLDRSPLSTMSRLSTSDVSVHPIILSALPP